MSYRSYNKNQEYNTFFRTQIISMLECKHPKGTLDHHQTESQIITLIFISVSEISSPANVTIFI